MERIRYQKRHSLGYFGNTDYRPFGTVKGYKCYICDDDEGPVWVEFVDPDNTDRRGRAKRVAEIILSETKRNVFEVDTTVLDTKYQGMGLAPIFYAYLLRRKGWTIKAGTAQSPGGRSIWSRLSRRKDVIIYGKTRTGRPTMMIENDEGELEPIFGRFEAYDGDREFEMYAVRAA